MMSSRSRYRWITLESSIRKGAVFGAPLSRDPATTLSPPTRLLVYCTTQQRLNTIGGRVPTYEMDAEHLHNRPHTTP
jgi:hypothetical protein